MTKLLNIDLNLSYLLIESVHKVMKIWYFYKKRIYTSNDLIPDKFNTKN